MMNKIKVKKKFREHVNKYDLKVPEISRKLYHSFRVMNLCELISKYYNFSEEDNEIAIIVGLLHDYARFEQWDKFGTFSDIKSVDHGDLGVKRLFLDGEIVDYCTKVEYYDVIYDAIKYHNKYSYPSGLDSCNELMCKVIRDADKLDIYYLYSVDKKLIEEDDEEISDSLKDIFYDNKLISYLDCKNKSESILLKLSMVFDLNFEFSFKYLYDTKLIGKIFEEIKNKEKFKPYFDYVKSYIEDKIRNI